jgi:hypothetical protein
MAGIHAAADLGQVRFQQTGVFQKGLPEVAATVEILANGALHHRLLVGLLDPQISFQEAVVNEARRQVAGLHGVVDPGQAAHIQHPQGIAQKQSPFDAKAAGQAVVAPLRNDGSPIFEQLAAGNEGLDPGVGLELLQALLRVEVGVFAVEADDQAQGQAVIFEAVDKAAAEAAIQNGVAQGMPHLPLQ